MRFHLLLSTLVFLLIGSAGVLVLEAQDRGVAERSPVMQSRLGIGLPDDEDDDEGDDEGCDDPSSPAPVPATGQLMCFWNGFQDSCSGTGADAEYRMGVTTVPRFVTHPDGTITDGLTGLTWLRLADCFGERSWRDALADTNALAHGACELTDGSVPGAWRLPNVRELQSLIDYGRMLPALPVDHPFSGLPSSWYWSSSSKADTDLDAWRVDLGVGTAELAAAAIPGHVLPVRGGIPPQHYVCDGGLTLCDCERPECPPGEIASVIDLCWGPCVNLSECLPW